MAAGLVYHNVTTASGVTFSVASWVPATGSPDVGAVQAHLITDGTSLAAVKAASTAPAASDPALVVAISPNSVNANGSATSANSAPVVIASDQAAVATKLAATTSGGATIASAIVPNNTTAVVVKSGAGQVYKIEAFNNSATIAYLKIYNATSATAGSGTPVARYLIPANTSGTGLVTTNDTGDVYSTGITYVVTTGIADNDTGAPAATTYIVNIHYK